MADLFKNGLVHVYYGDGKGKTTAAAGLAARVSGCGGRALFAQFLKNGASGELKALASLSGVDVLEGIPCRKFFKDMTERERLETVITQKGAFEAAKDKACACGYDLLVLDEIIDTVDLGIIAKDELTAFLKNKPAHLEVALTGHSVFPELLDAADYVSEVKKVKHPYDSGMRARRGAEF